MTPEQFRSALEALALTQVGAAAMLGISPRAVRNYLHGSRAISEPAARLVRLALAGKITTTDIQAAAN